MKRLLLAILLVFTGFGATGQNSVFVKGLVTDAENGNPIPFAQLASYEKMAIYSTDSLGRFNLMLEQTDSLRVLALGYSPITLQITQIRPDSLRAFTVSLARMPIMLKQVDVYKQSANEHLQKFMPDGIVLGYQNPTPVELRDDIGGKPPLIAAVISPASFAHYHLSKREKQKRKLRQILVDEKHASALSLELVAEITGLQEQELNDFFVYCNAHIKLTGKESNGYIRVKVIEALETYKAEKNEQEKK